MGITPRSTRIRHETPRRIRAWRKLIFAASISLGIAFAASGTSASAASGQRHVEAGGQQYYLDCGSGSDSAAGTSAHTAWRTLARLDTVTFAPGDSILLRRGTTCTGVLSPQGSGTAGNPIVVSAYGSGARPAIAGAGAPAAVVLHNVQDWEIRHLDVSDTTTPDGASRAGILVALDDYGTGSHYVISDVNVHDVTGCDCNFADLNASGGIVFKAGGSSVPTGFDGITVAGNTVSNADGEGIVTESTWSQRALFPAGSNSFVPITHLYIGWNRITNSGGDGILVQNGVDSLVEHNLVNGYSLRPTQFHAGLVAFNADHPVFQFNEVSHGAGPLPTWAIDVDGGDSDVVFQYNFSHDNVGGFLFDCAVFGTFTDGATIRYNISQNDTGAQFGSLIIPIVSNGCGGNPETNLSFYNNVLYTTTALALIGTLEPTVITFTNNIFVGRPGGSLILDPVGIYDHNIYSNVTSTPSADSHALTTDPMFTNPGAGTGFASVFGYTLTCGSPAIGAGAIITGNGGHDFFGFPVPSAAPPNIGAYQGPCLHG